jgi:acetyl esterase/lipase
MLALFSMSIGANAAARCYLDPVWSESALRLLPNIAYGSAFNNKTGEQQELLLDAYFPPTSDNRTKKPVLVFVHGGGFVNGDKTGEEDVTFMKKLVQRGFAAVSVNYRLTGEYWPWDTQRPQLDAVEDVRAAVRFVRSIAEQQHLDTDRPVPRIHQNRALRGQLGQPRMVVRGGGRHVRQRRAQGAGILQ